MNGKYALNTPKKNDHDMPPYRSNSLAESIFNQPHFQGADKAREYLESLRWANGVSCPHCGTAGEHYKLEGKSHRPGLCQCKDCREQFSVTVGTVFESSKVKLHVWLQACHLMSAGKKGVSSKQLQRMLGVTYKTARFMSHRIRDAMTANPADPLGTDGGMSEVDETFWSNKGRGRVSIVQQQPA